MESEKRIVESDIKKSTFMEHLFNFDDDTKNQLMNIVQYTVLALIPVILLNKGVAHLIPTVDEDRSSGRDKLANRLFHSDSCVRGGEPLGGNPEGLSTSNVVGVVVDKEGVFGAVPIALEYPGKHGRIGF